MSGCAALQIENPELPALKGRIFREQLDDLLRIGALLQFLKHERLIRVRVVDCGLTRGHAFAGDDDCLHVLQKIIALVDARRRRDDDAAGAAIDGDDGPRGERGRGERETREEKDGYFPHGR